MVERNKIFLLLGSNIEPRYTFLEEAEKQINSLVGNIIQSSKTYMSEPLGFSADANFLNRVVLLNSKFSPREVLTTILNIEKRMGRKRMSGGYSSRSIDIDILFFNDEIINMEDLIIPHPRIHERMFTLLPLEEIAPYYIHPVLNKSIKKLSDNCQDNSEVVIYKQPVN